MTIRARLVLSFTAILFLFAVNTLVHFWSNRARASSIEAARRAIDRQSRLASVTYRASNIQRHVTLLAQMPGEPLTPPEIDQVMGELDLIGRDLDQVVSISEVGSRGKFVELRKRFAELSRSWQVFYSSLGRDPGRAISELAIRSEPLSREVVQGTLPQLQRDEQNHVSSATAEMYRIATLTGQFTLGIFIATTALAIAIAYLLSRYLTRTLDILRVGAGRIGKGEFDVPICTETNDELGELAAGFNEMRTNLKTAHEQLTGANAELQKRNAELDEARRTSENLLLNILPAPIAEELRVRGYVEPKVYQDVTILFTDFASFSPSTEKVRSQRLIQLLNEYFTKFDEIVSRYKLEKLKTIGDSYMCAGGIPTRNESHAVDAVMAGLEMLQHVLDQRRRSNVDLCWDIRIGIHTGSVIAGVVGIRKFAFDVWETDVNYSSRMESSGLVNHVNISERTYQRIKDFFDCDYRGKILTKDNRYADMYVVKRIVPALADGKGLGAPPAFAAKYSECFGCPPPAFPNLNTLAVAAD